MTSLISARRAAEDFARVVDGTQQDVADRYADLTATVDLLRRHESPAARPEFVADLRTQLMSAADTLLVPVDGPGSDTGRDLGTVVPLRPGRRQRRLAAAAAAFVVVGGTAGVAAAAEGSLPGDPLYPLKRGIESAQVSLNTSDAAKGQELLAQAGTRLDEIAGLVRNGDASRISDTLSSYRRSVAGGSDLIFVAYQRDPSSVDLARLRGTIGSQSDRLRELADRAPSSTQPGFRSAATLLADIDQQARVLCGNCGPASSGADFTALTSSPTLESLINEPADAAAAQRQRELTKSLAQKADEIAAKTPIATAQAPSGGTATTSGGSGQVLPGVSLPSGTGSTGTLTGTVTTATDSVQGLVDSVGTATGLTPLTETVNGTLGTATGLLSGGQ